MPGCPTMVGPPMVAEVQIPFERGLHRVTRVKNSVRMRCRGKPGAREVGSTRLARDGETATAEKAGSARDIR